MKNSPMQRFRHIIANFHNFWSNHDLRIGLFALSCSVLFAVFGFSTLYGAVTKDMSAKNLQISSLIYEVGTLKEENMSLNKKIVQFERNYRRENISEKVSLKSSEAENSPPAKIPSEPPSESAYSENILDILLLGTHGQLTDTIMLASINPQLQTLTLMSIPRDTYVHGRKLNEAYKMYGIDTLKAYVEEITGIRPDRYVVIDLRAFVEVIDAIGGITVSVDRDLQDFQYPTSDGGYTTFSLAKGVHNMDGELALKYSRSRHSTSDFDRALRQQKVLQAILSKIQSLPIHEKVQDALKLASSLLEKVTTDINALELVTSYSKYHRYTFENGNVLSTSNYLYSTYNQGGQYILLPRGDTFQNIQTFLRKLVME